MATKDKLTNRSTTTTMDSRLCPAPMATCYSRRPASPAEASKAEDNERRPACIDGTCSIARPTCKHDGGGSKFNQDRAGASA